MTVGRIAASDDEVLADLMNSCVRNEASFHGKCGTWSRKWARELIARCPDTVVLERGDGVTLGFLEIPPIQPKLASPNNLADRAAVAAHALQERNRVTFRVTAAGINEDLLVPEDAVRTFHDLLFHSFRRARELGYEYVESFAPWEKHPKLSKRWVDYPGLEMVEPPALGEGGEGAVYWTRWRLDDALDALVAEGLTADVIDDAV